MTSYTASDVKAAEAECSRIANEISAPLREEACRPASRQRPGLHDQIVKDHILWSEAYERYEAIKCHVDHAYGKFLRMPDGRIVTPLKFKQYAR